MSMWEFAEDRKTLSPEEVEFWKKEFERTLKIGVELEFNLNFRDGMCKGTKNCRCIHYAKGCKDDCGNYNDCKKTPNRYGCLNRETILCKDDCENCSHFEFSCIKENCLNFVPACITCKKFDKGCDICSDRYDIKKDPDAIRQYLTEVLKPTFNWGKIGEYCVAEITTDGSLANGVEITTSGLKFHKEKLFSSLEKIISEALDKDAYVNERTSIHINLLTTYYRDNLTKRESLSNVKTNELLKPIPEIIVANFLQLVRKYQNALTWLSMALPYKENRTRWEKFRLSLLSFNPLFKNIKAVLEEIERYCSNNGRYDYGFANFSKMVNAYVKNSFEVFHVEMRVMDNIPIPEVILAMCALFQAMIFKAISMSKYGTLILFKEELQKAQTIKGQILNGKGSWDSPRFSETTISEGLAMELEESAIELINLVKEDLNKIDRSLYKILISLAKEPISYRLERKKINLKDMRYKTKEIWTDLREPFRELFKFEKSKPSEIPVVLKMIHKLVEFKEIKADDIEDWINKAINYLYRMKKLDITKDELAEVVEDKIKKGEWEWVDDIKTFSIGGQI